MGRGGRSGSASAMIYGALRDDILSLRRRPTEPVIEKEIAERFGVSRTPVREALLKLAGEGLVEVFPQSGTFVARIPYAALPEAIVIRQALEEKTARLAALRASDGEIAELAARLGRMREAADQGDNDGFHAADEAFHAVIAKAAGFPGIWRLVQQVKVQVDRFRRLTLPQAGRMGRVLDEHTAVLAAIGAHDPEAAVAAMSDHLGILLTDIRDIRHLNPDYFAGARNT